MKPLTRSHVHPFIFSALLLATPTLAQTTPAQPAQPLRYCNPLPMPIGPNAQASGDVTVIREKDTYYMYCTGGGAWTSTDLVNWQFQRVTFQGNGGGGNIPVAPHVVKYNNAFYMAGNDQTRNGVAGSEGIIYKSDNPLGPFSYLGTWQNTGDPNDGWRGAFDIDIFIDSDNKPYLYFPGRSTAGIYVVPLDPADLTKFAAKPTHLFSFDTKHTWEHYGEMNEYSDVAWIEGPWMQKINNTYYLQYSASGTQWKTYAEGYYTAKSPTGPFTYAANNPLLRKTDGLVTGTGHGSCVQGPDGNYWQFYTIVLSNPPGGRRIGMDPITFDKDGLMSVKVTDTPQNGPYSAEHPFIMAGDGVIPAPIVPSIPVTINKLRAMNATSSFSSQRPGHDAAYAIDNSSGTWWEPDLTDNQPTLTIELSPATRFDPVQSFTIDSARLMFGGAPNRAATVRERPAAATTPSPIGPEIGDRLALGFEPVPAPNATPANVYQYKIEASPDGLTYTTVLDQTKNTTPRNTLFDEIPPTKCRYVRFTVTNWPRNPNVPLGVIEFTVFGKPAEAAPAPVSTQPAGRGR